MSRVGADGRTCGSCRYYYELAFECRCNPPSVLASERPGGRDRAAYPPRDPGDVACGEWSAPRTQAAGAGAVLTALDSEMRAEARAARGRGW